MQKFSRVLGVFLLLSLMVSAGLPDKAKAEGVYGYASVDVLTNYVWRGQNLGDDGVVQPSIHSTKDNLTLNIWSNYDLKRNRNNEVDVTLNYSVESEGMSIDAGYIYYALKDADDTQELYISAALEMYLAPTVTLYLDFDEGDGGFLVMSVGHDISLDEDSSLHFGASASLNIENKVMGGEFTNWYNSELTASYTMNIAKNVILEPKMAYSFALSNDAERAIRSASVDNDDKEFYAGVNMTMNF
ncbi:MAG: hypothetical protein IMF07_02235 [Proteobacteria bacterium]|nr:hypothetical protein [Pseudomonadota bacterium]